jgi:hypothetical protein
MPYHGRAIRSGNSRGMSFEAALFRSHPEFAAGRFAADYLGPGTLLVRHVPESETIDLDERDPILDAYLAFIEREMEAHPENIKPLSESLRAEVEELTGGVEVDLDEDLGDGAYLP